MTTYLTHVSSLQPLVPSHPLNDHIYWVLSVGKKDDSRVSFSGNCGATWVEGTTASVIPDKPQHLTLLILLVGISFLQLTSKHVFVD